MVDAKAIAKEFRDFILRGNVVDMAVGVIIGAAFCKIVSSMVDDILMPPIGLLLGKVNFSDLFVALNGVTYDSLDMAKKAGAPVVAYGMFINNVINLLIVGFVIFTVVRQLSKIVPKPSAAPTKDCPLCCSSIPAADRKSTRLNSSHRLTSRMPSSA
jgi:large conductance mechanosensitive channel